MVNYLMQADPVEGKKATHKKGGAMVSGTLAGRGPRTNVDLRWYPNHEFRNLNKEQKTELSEWRATPEGKAAMDKQMKSERENRKRKRHDNGKGTGDKKSGAAGATDRKEIQKLANKLAKAQVKSAFKKATKETKAEEEMKSHIDSTISAAIADKIGTDVKISASKVTFDEKAERRLAETQSEARVAKLLGRAAQNVGGKGKRKRSPSE